MKKNLFITTALAFLAFTACQQEKFEESDVQRDGFRVYAEDTKAVLDGVEVAFEDADAIDIYVDDATTPVVYTYSQESGLFVDSGTEANGSEYSVLFPSVSTDPSRSTINIPNRQVATVNSFPKNAMYMAGVSSTKEVMLKHLMGLWEIDILPQYDGQKMVRASLKMDGGHKINGNFTIDWTDNSLTYVDGGNNAILLADIGYTMTAGESVKLYFALPEGTYDGGFTFTATMTDGTIMSKSSPSTINIRRGQITKVKHEVNYTIFDSGSGTEEDPYIIMSATQWNNMAAKINRDPSNYASAYYKLGADIDFENDVTDPIDTFKGVLDGAGFTVKNAKIGDGTASHQGFFYLLNGTVKNVTFDNITVVSSSSSATENAATSAGVIVSGNNTNVFTLENCHVINSSVTSGLDGETYGAYAGGLVGRAKNENVTIRNCSVRDTEVSCIVESAGGIIGVFSEGTIDSVVSEGNTISGNKSVGGVAGTAGSNALIINCMSLDNTCEVSTIGAGGVVGANAWLGSSTGEHPQLVNILSRGNNVKSTYLSSANLFLGLIVGGRNSNDSCMTLKNCLTLSGKATYSYLITTNSNYPHAGCVGIMIGYGSPAVENCYYNANYVRKYDEYLDTVTTRTDDKTGGWRRNAVGLKQNNITSDSKGGTTLTGITSYLTTPLTDGTCLGNLNNWVEANKTTYPTLKSWVAGSDNYPTLILEDTAQTNIDPLNIVESTY